MIPSWSNMGGLLGFRKLVKNTLRDYGGSDKEYKIYIEYTKNM